MDPSADPARLLIETRPDVRLVRPSTLPHDRLDVRWDHDNTVDTWIVRDPTRDPSDRCALGFYVSDHEGTFPMFLRFTPPAPTWADGVSADAAGAFERVVDHGTTPEGPVRWSFYLYGADLDALRRAGVRLSLPTARCLEAAIRAPLLRLHAAGLVHGALTARRMRLVLVPEPYREDDAPIRLCAPRFAPAAAGAAETELEQVAAAVDALTSGPDGGDPAAELTELWGAVAREERLVEGVFPRGP